MEPSQSAESGGIRWVRKRDQRLVACDPARIAHTLLLAARDAAASLSDEEAAELARMVLFLAARASDDATISSEELAEWVTKCLQNTGHTRLAEAYARYAEQRARFRREATVLPAAGRAARPWDKGLVRQFLEDHTTLDPGRCAEVARRTEEALLRCGLRQIPLTLVWSTVQAVLSELALPPLGGLPEHVLLTTAALHELAAQSASPERAAWAVANLAWREQAFLEQLPPDAARWHVEGVLGLHGPWCPGQLGGLVLNAAARASQVAEPTALVHRLGRALALWQPYTAHVLAVDLVDVAVGLVADREEDAYELAEAVWEVLHTAALHCPGDLVINLYGRVPPRAYGHATPGPLFRSAPEEPLQRRVEVAATALLEKFREEGEDIPHLTVDYHWAPDLPDALPRSAGLALGMALVGRRVRFVLDRYVAMAGDGLVAVEGSATLAVATLDIARLAAEVGEQLPVRGSGVFEPLCDAVLRVAVQRRERLRELLPFGVLPLRAAQQGAVVLCPVGLDAAVRRLVGHGIAEHPTGTACAVALVETLRRVADRHAASYALTVRLDRWSPRLALAADDAVKEPMARFLPGLTSWAPGRGLREQLHRVGQLHRRARCGTLLIPLPVPPPWSVTHVAEVLNWAYEASATVRLQFVPYADRGTELWAEP